jgi:uncharacterized repeat protein (TIGR02543 family)
MGKTLAKVIIFLFLASLLLTSCPGEEEAAATYTVTFRSNSGGISVSGMPSPVTQQVKNGSTINRPASDPTRTGYIFNGWYKEAAGINEWNFVTDTVTRNTDIHAGWAAISYTVRYNANGDGVTGSMADSVFIYDVNTTLGTNAFIRQGYRLSGWATSPGGERVFRIGEFVANLAATQDAIVDLYAFWMQAIPSDPWTTRGGFVTEDNFQDIVKASISNSDNGEIVRLFDPVMQGSIQLTWDTDSSLTSEHGTDPIPAYIALDLGEERVINKVILNFGSSNDARHMQNYSFAITSDDEKWEILKNNRGITAEFEYASHKNEIIGNVAAEEAGIVWKCFLSSNNSPLQNNTFTVEQFIGEKEAVGRYVIVICDPDQRATSGGSGSMVAWKDLVFMYE